MALSIEQVIASGDFQIGSLDSKSRIAPITQNGKPLLIIPFSPWPSFDGGERISINLRTRQS